MAGIDLALQATTEFRGKSQGAIERPVSNRGAHDCIDEKRSSSMSMSHEERAPYAGDGFTCQAGYGYTRDSSALTTACGWEKNGEWLLLMDTTLVLLAGENASAWAIIRSWHAGGMALSLAQRR